MWLDLLLLLVVVRHAELVHALHVHRVQPAEIDLVRKILYLGQTSNAVFIYLFFWQLVEFHIPVRKRSQRQASRKKDQKKLRTVPLVLFSRAGATRKYPANLKRHP